MAKERENPHDPIIFIQIFDIVLNCFVSSILPVLVANLGKSATTMDLQNML